MKKFVLALALSFLLFVSMAAAKMETVDMGPFKAEFDMGDAAGEHQFIVYPPMQEQDHNTYWFRVDSGGKGWYIDVYVDDYGKPVDISEGFDLVSVNSSLNSRVNIFNPYSRSWT